MHAHTYTHTTHTNPHTHTDTYTYTPAQLYTLIPPQMCVHMCVCVCTTDADTHCNHIPHDEHNQSIDLI